MSLAKQSLMRASPALTAMLRTRAMQGSPARFFNVQKRFLNLQPTRRLMRVSEGDERAHTISQRIRQIKKVPVELLPLGIVLLVAIVAAIYSLFRKLWTDKTLRLWRSNKAADD